MKKQEGVKTVILSGLRATVIMDDGAALEEDDVKAAIEGKKMKFVSMEKTEISRPKAAYELTVTGAT